MENPIDGSSFRSVNALPARVDHDLHLRVSHNLLYAVNNHPLASTGWTLLSHRVASLNERLAEFDVREEERS